MISMFQQFYILTVMTLLIFIPITSRDIPHLRSYMPRHQAYKDNLLVQNWYYGSIDPVDYRLRVFEVAADQVTTPCPLQKPFSNKDMNGCELCPPEVPLRNIGSSLCQPCPSGTSYNQDIGNCTETPQTQSTPTAQTTPTQVEPIAVTPTTTQSQSSTNQTNQQQFFEPIVVTPTKANQQQSNTTTTNVSDVQQEQNTTSPSSSSTTNQTSSSANGTSVVDSSEVSQVMDQSVQQQSNQNQTASTPTQQTTPQNQTQSTPTSSPPSSSSSTSTSTSSSSSPNLVGLCPKNRPYWNKYNKQCEVCPIDKLYDIESNSCQYPVYIFNVYATNYIQEKEEQIHDINLEIEENNPADVTRSCSLERPYVVVRDNRSECVGCLDGEYFLVGLRVCVSGCQNGGEYNATSKMCGGGAETQPESQQLKQDNVSNQSSINATEPQQQNTTAGNTTTTTTTSNTTANKTTTNNTTTNNTTTTTTTTTTNNTTPNNTQCPKNQTYLPKYNSCLPYVYIYNKNSTRLIYSQPSTITQQNKKFLDTAPPQIIKQCPLETPYVIFDQNGYTRCTGCEKDQYFVVYTKKYNCVGDCNQIYEGGLEKYYYDQGLSVCVMEEAKVEANQTRNQTVGGNETQIQDSDQSNNTSGTPNLITNNTQSSNTTNTTSSTNTTNKTTINATTPTNTTTTNKTTTTNTTTTTTKTPTTNTTPNTTNPNNNTQTTNTTTNQQKNNTIAIKNSTVISNNSNSQPSKTQNTTQIQIQNQQLISASANNTNESSGQNTSQKYIPRSSIPLPIANLTGTRTHNCPTDTPFYNQTTQQCEKCPQGKQYQKLSGRCLHYIYTYNKQSKNLILPSSDYISKFQDSLRFQNPTRKLSECPDDRPYLREMSDGQYQCISCDNGWYYSVATQQCIQSCPVGTIYHQSDHLCKDGQMYVNPNATNLYFKSQQNYKKWDQQNKKDKQSKPNTEYCPIQQPYLKDGKCMNCEGQTPLYDVQKDECTNCGRGRYYDGEGRVCRTAGFTDAASVERMVANIF